jgi:hypothetical protein
MDFEFVIYYRFHIYNSRPVRLVSGRTFAKKAANPTKHSKERLSIIDANMQRVRELLSR